MPQVDIFGKVARIIRGNLSKEEFIQFSNELDSDSVHEFDDAVNKELMEVAPEVFGEEPNQS